MIENNVKQLKQNKKKVFIRLFKEKGQENSEFLRTYLTFHSGTDDEIILSNQNQVLR